MALLQEKLPECTTKQKADEFCVSFCYLNSKGARKRLVAALLKIPRSRSELTATYARWVICAYLCTYVLMGHLHL